MPFEEKFFVMDEAKIRYGLLMELLTQINEEDPYSLMPDQLKQEVKEFERCGNIRNSSDFLYGLEREILKIKVPAESTTKLEKIVNVKVFGEYLGVLDQYKKYLKTG